jgi:hypothetical protein
LILIEFSEVVSLVFTFPRLLFRFALPLRLQAHPGPQRAGRAIFVKIGWLLFHGYARGSLFYIFFPGPSLLPIRKPAKGGFLSQANVFFYSDINLNKIKTKWQKKYFFILNCRSEIARRLAI